MIFRNVKIEPRNVSFKHIRKRLYETLALNIYNQH
jgi:hypothetical protein